jgi:2-methylisocitrate lyase-like PEP mutase family enzyme
MTTPVERAVLLRNLHVKGHPLVLFNIWDAGSAKTIQNAGAKVIATGSWSVAAAHGYEDGEKLPFDLVLANLNRIISSVNLPVTIDLEGCYGQSPTEVQATIVKILEAGAVGINFEDQIIGGAELYSVENQCARIGAIRSVAERMTIPLFVNARTDIFLKIDPAKHNDSHLEEAIHRASVYAESGADGYFVPGLISEKYIEKLCAISPVPINVMMMPGMSSPKQLAELGVARISYGQGPYCQTMDALKEAGRIALA